MQSGFQGFDYSEEPKEFCECIKPDFDKAGICHKCGRKLKGVTLSVDSVYVDAQSVIRFIPKEKGE